MMDCGCDDLDRARLNREIISKKLYVCAYIQVENALAGLAVSGELPYWMPKDNSVVSKKETAPKHLYTNNDGDLVV